MTGIKYLWLYLISLAIFLLIDTVWLFTMSGRFYKPQLGDLMSDQPNLPVALLFYLFYVVGVIILAVMPGVDAGSVGKAALYGAILGFVAYGTYDFTNLATLRDWPVIVTVVDLIWGTTLTAVMATVGFYTAKWLGA
ncbi:MAG TPA: DUF2177 family protein [Coriobacteriia bacterium]|nr:DUF2177 family protein [Coriobacteriia bacterium]